MNITNTASTFLQTVLIKDVALDVTACLIYSFANFQMKNRRDERGNEEKQNCSFWPLTTVPQEMRRTFLMQIALECFLFVAMTKHIISPGKTRRENEADCFLKVDGPQIDPDDTHLINIPR